MTNAEMIEVVQGESGLPISFYGKGLENNISHVFADMKECSISASRSASVLDAIRRLV